jgi:hypothetical protein
MFERNTKRDLAWFYEIIRDDYENLKNIIDNRVDNW